MKSNTNELRKELTTLLKTVTTNVYYRKISRPTKPYIVFTVKELSTTAGRTSCQLEVNCVAKTPAAVNTMADSVQDIFDGEIDNGTKLMFYAFRGSRQIVEEEDKSIERIRLMIDLYVYSKEEETQNEND